MPQSSWQGDDFADVIGLTRLGGEGYIEFWSWDAEPIPPSIAGGKGVSYHVRGVLTVGDVSYVGFGKSWCCYPYDKPGYAEANQQAFANAVGISPFEMVAEDD